MKYTCISADSHLEIRPDRYTKRVPEKFRDRAPKVISLKVSPRARPDHSLHVIVNHVLEAAGFSLGDIVSWGGQVRYDAPEGHLEVSLHPAAERYWRARGYLS